MTTKMTLRELLVACDSELSAQAHGRPASDKYALLTLSERCRELYEAMPKTGDVVAKAAEVELGASK